MSAVGAVGQERRKFLHRFCGLCIVFAPMIFLQAKSRAQQDSRPLNNGELKTAVTVHAHKFSASAKEAIEKAGGKAILIGGEPQVA